MTNMYCGLLSDEFHTFFMKQLFELLASNKNAQPLAVH
jgi:hypothetical protein